MLDARSELVEVRSEKTVLVKELDDMLLRLHQLQLQLQESSSNTVPDSEAIKTKLVSRYLSGIKTWQVFIALGF